MKIRERLIKCIRRDIRLAVNAQQPECLARWKRVCLRLVYPDFDLPIAENVVMSWTRGHRVQPVGHANFHPCPNSTNPQDLPDNFMNWQDMLQAVRGVQIAAAVISEGQDSAVKVADKIRSRQLVHIQPIRQAGSATAAQFDSFHRRHTSASQYCLSYKSPQSSRNRHAASSLAA